MKGLRRPVSALIKSRGLAAAAAQAQASSVHVPLPKNEAEVSKLSNGLIVASLENNAPVSRVGFFIGAGSRFENSKNFGVTHALRNAANLSCQTASTFAITNNIQQNGGNMTCSTTRDHMMYSVESVRTGIDKCVAYLSQAVTRPDFAAHEVAELPKKLRLDLGVLDQNPETRLMEALHQTAFRCGMGNSLYSPDYMVGNHTSDMLQEYIRSLYTSGNMAIVGVGVDHDHLVSHAKSLEFQSGSQAAPQAKYHGGEYRVRNNSDVVYAAVVSEGVGMNSPDSLAGALLMHVMGATSSMKYRSPAGSSKVTKAVGTATSQPFGASCFNTIYSNTALFGFQVAAQASDMTPVLQSLVKTFADATKGGITEQDLQRAKSQLKAGIYYQQEDGNALLERIANQAMMQSSVLSDKEIEAAIDAVTLQQVQSVAKKVINSTPTMVAMGDLSNTPYLDELL